MLNPSNGLLTEANLWYNLHFAISMLLVERSAMARKIKPKLLIILGAGSSIAQGLPSTDDLNQLFRKWSFESNYSRLRNFFDELWKSAEEHYATRMLGIVQKPNYETILGNMLILGTWMGSAPFGDPMISVVGEIDPHSLLSRFNKLFSTPAAGRIFLHMQYSELIGRLAQHMRSASQMIDKCGSAFRRYKHLISSLSKNFDVGIYSLNYDNVAHRAWPRAFTGFDQSGRFCPRIIHRQTNWGFLYHLHGSVHHTLERDSKGRLSITWQEDLAKQFVDVDEELEASESSPHYGYLPTATLIAGRSKNDQLLSEPFQSFYTSLVRDAYQADAILVGGYGFNDIHINRALKNSRAGRHVRIMILTFAPECYPRELDNDSLVDDSPNWLNSQAAWSGYKAPGFSTSVPNSTLIANKSFDVSGDGIAIWPAGFLEATARTESLVNWLSGTIDDDALGPNRSSTNSEHEDVV